LMLHTVEDNHEAVVLHMIYNQGPLND
jgi:hypothetical protein